MEDSSIKQCKHLMELSCIELRKACDRMARHDVLIVNLMNPKHKIGKALRSIEWLEEVRNGRTLNAYGGRPKPSWNIVKKALEDAHIYGAMSYVTLIPDKMELHNAGGELILEFASKDYYRLIVDLKLIIDKKE